MTQFVTQQIAYKYAEQRLKCVVPAYLSRLFLLRFLAGVLLWVGVSLGSFEHVRNKKENYTNLVRDVLWKTVCVLLTVFSKNMRICTNLLYP